MIYAVLAEVLVGRGTGERAICKQFWTCGVDKPILIHTIEKFVIVI